MLLPPESWIFLKTIFLPHFLLPPYPPIHCRCLQLKYCVLWKMTKLLGGKFWRGRDWIVCDPFVLRLMCIYIFKDLWSLIWPKGIYLAVIKPEYYLYIQSTRIIISLIVKMQSFPWQYKATQKKIQYVPRSYIGILICRFKAPKPSELVMVQYIEKEREENVTHSCVFSLELNSVWGSTSPQHNADEATSYT